MDFDPANQLLYYGDMEKVINETLLLTLTFINFKQYNLSV